VHGTNYTQPAGVLSQVWKQLADPYASFAVLAKLEGRTEDIAFRWLLSAEGIGSHRLACEFVEARLVVKQVDMAGTTPHEQEDDATRALLQVRERISPGRSGICGRCRMVSQRGLSSHCRQAQSGKAAGGTLQELSTGQRIRESKAAHSHYSMYWNLLEANTA
jgi:hypothetical protein